MRLRSRLHRLDRHLYASVAQARLPGFERAEIDPEPSGLANGPGVSGFTDQKSSATSSVLLALSHRWKD
ncbi:hypothetical protein [Nonomuraea recticatena]|uniref:Uncharacterized protein n=1 Tax=Nonomuraea recticatena TaxID=46178 RepID=A0ABP6FTH4_9ACTN